MDLTVNILSHKIKTLNVSELGFSWLVLYLCIYLCTSIYVCPYVLLGPIILMVQSRQVSKEQKSSSSGYGVVIFDRIYLGVAS